MESIQQVIWRDHWWKNSGLLKLNLCLSIVLLASFINGVDSSILNGLQILPNFKTHFNYPDGSTLGFMSAAQNFGALVVLPISPLISDGIGRRKAITIGCAFITGGVAVQATASNVGQFIASRCLIGIGITMLQTAAPVLTTELAYPTQRAAITALYNTVWYVGSIVSAWVCYITLRTLSDSDWEWRVPSMLQAAPAVFLGITVCFLPESPRWLVAQGRDAEAIAILSKYHANGRERDPLVYFTYGQIREALAIEREINETTTYLTLFKTRGNRRRMRIIFAVGFFSQWSGNGLLSYYLDPVLENVGVSSEYTRALINGGIQIWSLIVAVTASLLVEVVGRRPLFLTSQIGMIAVFVFWTLTTALWTTQENRDAANASIAFMPLYFLAYSIAYTPLLLLYAVEILPYHIRAKGFAMVHLTIGIGITTNQFVNPIALKAIGWKLYIVYCCWLVFELVFIFLYLVETKGKTLEETAALFDGKEVVQNIENVGHEAAHQTRHRYRQHVEKASSGDEQVELGTTDISKRVGWARRKGSVPSDVSKSPVSATGVTTDYTSGGEDGPGFGFGSATRIHPGLESRPESMNSTQPSIVRRMDEATEETTRNRRW